MPGKAGRFGADRQPTAMMQNFAVTLSPRSVSISQLIGVLVECCRRDAGIEHDLAAQVEAVGDVVGVSEDFRLRRILLRPVPFLVQFLREREGILHALDVAAGAGIAIPVPRPANAAAGFVNPRGESEPAQPMQHVQAGKARADHDGVKRPRFGARAAALA